MLYGLLTALGLATAYGLFILPTQWLLIERVRIPLGLNCKIVQISDLHVDMLRISPQTLATVVRSERPDFIFLTGDFTRRPYYIPKLERYIRSLTDIGIPVYAVLGNHDYKNRSLANMLAVLKRMGVVMLRNESVDAGPFRLVGIDDYCTGYANVEKAFRKVTGSKPVIVMTHDPNVVTRIRHPFHLLVSGHLHGKQFNVPFFFKIKNKGELPSRGIYKGLHQSPNGPYYISKGIGQAGLNARFLVRSEITVHEL